MNNAQRIELERQIVRRVIREAAASGWKPVYVYDGGEHVKVNSEKAALDVVFSVDESTITFQGPNRERAGALIILGESYDVLTDYNPKPGFDEAMERVYDYVNALQAGERVAPVGAVRKNPARRLARVGVSAGRYLSRPSQITRRAPTKRLAKRRRTNLRAGRAGFFPNPPRPTLSLSGHRGRYYTGTGKSVRFRLRKSDDPRKLKRAIRRAGKDARKAGYPVMRVNPTREVITITGKRSGRVLGYATPDTPRAELGRAALLLANEHLEPVKIERKKLSARGLPENVQAYVNNPAPRSSEAISRAARRFSRFTGHRAERVEMMPFPSRPKAGLAVGPVLVLGYVATRDGKRENYLHKFAPHARPMLVASEDGKALYLIGGRYHFTERGIVDKRK